MMGECTSGIAAVRLGRRFIGIEINSDKFKIASAKITNAVLANGNKTSGQDVAHRDRKEQ